MTVRAADLAPVEEPGPPEYQRHLGRLYKRSDLRKLPKPQPLIEGVLMQRSAVLMVGETGTNKTFAALGFACSVATGKPWLDRRVVRTGPVLLVVGEGAYGLDSRITAWEEENGAEVTDAQLVISVQPDQLTDPGVPAAIGSQARDMGAALVILDTFSSLAPGADETTDAATITRWISDVSAMHDCTVILVHHTGWGPKDRARGGSQLEANVDEVLALEKVNDDKDSPVKIKRKKVKDGPAGELIYVQRKQVGTSVVLEEIVMEPSEGKPSAMRPEDVQERLLAWINDHNPQTKTNVLKQFMVETKIGKTKADAAWATLEDLGRIRHQRGTVVEATGPKTRMVWVGLGKIGLNRDREPRPE